MIDLSNLPGGGGFILALGLYAAASILGGQVVAERMTEKSGWLSACESALRADIEARRPAPPPARKRTDCESRIGWIGIEAVRLCRQLDNPDLELPGERAEREAAELWRRTQERALAHAAARTDSRCECAVAVYRREHLIELGLYAGSARMISLPEVEGMERELETALEAPACGFSPEARS